MFKQGSNDDGVVLRDFYVEHDPVDLVCPWEEGMTRQEFADECNINVMMAKYETTGVFDRFNMRDPLYLDVSNVPDLAGALQMLELASEAFMRLPAVTRREFDNDPVKFVAFAEDPANLSKMREWGLARPQEPAGAVSGAGPTPTAPAPSAASTAPVSPPVST